MKLSFECPNKRNKRILELLHLESDEYLDQMYENVPKPRGACIRVSVEFSDGTEWHDDHRNIKMLIAEVLDDRKDAVTTVSTAVNDLSDMDEFYLDGISSEHRDIAAVLNGESDESLKQMYVEGDIPRDAIARVLCSRWLVMEAMELEFVETKFSPDYPEGRRFCHSEAFEKRCIEKLNAESDWHLMQLYRNIDKIIPCDLPHYGVNFLVAVKLSNGEGLYARGGFVQCCVVDILNGRNGYA